MGGIIKIAGEIAKLLEENIVSGRVEDKSLLHRYSRFIQRLSMVDIIAGERAGVTECPWLLLHRRATPAVTAFVGNLE